MLLSPDVLPEFMRKNCPNGTQQPNNYLFQLSMACFFISYLCVGRFYALLFLHTALGLGSFLFALWGLIYTCALDVALWNAAFIIMNILHIVYILYKYRPIKFSRELELVYKDFFKPLKVTRPQFKRLIQCMREIQVLKPKEAYCIEKLTKVENLSLVLSGRLAVSQKGRVLHLIDNRQFLDSPEWFGVCTGEFYEVTITALDECRILVWHRDKLKLSIHDDEFLQAVFDNILGKDVVKKLMLITESSCNGVNLHLYEDNSNEDTKLIPKGREKQTGVSFLLTRQIGGRDLNVWSIAKYIDKNCDVETPV